MPVVRLEVQFKIKIHFIYNFPHRFYFNAHIMKGCNILFYQVTGVLLFVFQCHIITSVVRSCVANRQVWVPWFATFLS